MNGLLASLEAMSATTDELRTAVQERRNMAAETPKLAQQKGPDPELVGMLADLTSAIRTYDNTLFRLQGRARDEVLQVAREIADYYESEMWGGQ